jgi:hypothetical protein
LAENNKLDYFKSLVDSAMYLYAATNSSSPKQISSNDVFRSMEELVHFVALTDYDRELFKDLGLESRTTIDAMKNIFLATAYKPGSDVADILSESLHPFTYLYENFVKVFNINNSIFKETVAAANILADQPLENAYLFSMALNNKTFKMNFKTHDYLAEKLKEEYTKTTHAQFDKIIQMRKTLFEKKDKKYAASVFRILDNQAVTLESASAVSHGSDLVHPQKYNNILVFLRDYNQSTKDVYGTGQLLKDLQQTN